MSSGRKVTSWAARDAARALRMPTDADDQSSRGVVGLRTGSDAYPGAAVLGVEAAWRSGAGMVRYVGPDRPTALVLQRRPETVTAAGRVQAWVIGSGTVPATSPGDAGASAGASGRVGPAGTRSAEETTALRVVLAGDVPVIVDAGAMDLAGGTQAPVLVTPHAGEFARLRTRLGLNPDDDDRERTVAETAAALGAAVLLKGARTLVATPSGDVIAVQAGTPWLAAAGSGDVLAATIGAVVAGQVAARPLTAGDLAALAASAAWIHGTAARVAAGQVTAVDAASDSPSRGPGHPIVALDVAEAIPDVIGALLALHHDA